MSTSTCRLIVIEDHDATRKGLCGVLASCPDMIVTGSAADHPQARVLLQTDFDVALVDLELADGRSLDLIREIVAVPGRKCLVLTVFGDEASVLSAIAAGATGYVLKDDSDIADSVRQTFAGNSPLSPSVARYLLRQVQDSSASKEGASLLLTRRETQVLENLAQGRSYRETADILRVSYNTVSDHIKAIYRKLAVNSRGEAVFTALSQGLIRLNR